MSPQARPCACADGQQTSQHTFLGAGAGACGSEACTKSSEWQSGAGGGEVAGVPRGVPFPPVVPKNLLLGWDESGGTFPGEVGGVAMPQTADGLQSVPWEVSEARE